MDFFTQQERARRHTLRLIAALLAAVAGVIAAADLVVMLGAWWVFDQRHLPILFHQALAGTILAAILLFTLRRMYSLRNGGESIVKMVKARRIMRNAKNAGEARLLNVVEEMAIASGLAAPSVWVMDNEESVNAFAAGYSPNQAVIVVTRGTLTRLNRDELQGVIGHEFSHILNGDMRLNVRLIGILAGIVVVGEAGLLVIRLGADAGDWGALVFIFLGALLSAVGYIGVFFGRIIKAAVSRQREFLADASSVQFTRNPGGLASALEKIRHAESAVVGSAFAGEMSHMFFSQAISMKIFADLLASHPPIGERLDKITGIKPEPAEKAPDALAPSFGEIARKVIARVGTVTPESAGKAGRLLASMPDSLRQSLDSPQGARAVVYAYLISPRPDIRAIQDRALAQAGDGAMKENLKGLSSTLNRLGPAARLPTLALALPALQRMDQPAREVFLAAVDELVEADSEVTLVEFVIRTILQRQLSGKASRAERVRYRSVKAVKASALLALAALAHAGGSPEAQKIAFARGAARLGMEEETLDAQSKPAAGAMSAALDQLRQLAPLIKRDILLACVDTALADNKLLVAEAELLRAIGMALDCPLPPGLETLDVG
jgi:Zn-dependent protease with chaperone function